MGILVQYDATGDVIGWYPYLGMVGTTSPSTSYMSGPAEVAPGIYAEVGGGGGAGLAGGARLNPSVGWLMAGLSGALLLDRVEGSAYYQTGPSLTVGPNPVQPGFAASASVVVSVP